MKLGIEPVPVLDPADRGGQRQLIGILRRIGWIFDGRISLGDGTNKENLDIDFADITSHAMADTEFAVSHSLGRVPAGYIVVKGNKAGVVYDGATVWTTSNIYLKCNVASVALRLIIF